MDEFAYSTTPASLPARPERFSSKIHTFSGHTNDISLAGRNTLDSQRLHKHGTDSARRPRDSPRAESMTMSPPPMVTPFELGSRETKTDLASLRPSYDDVFRPRKKTRDCRRHDSRRHGECGGVPDERAALTAERVREHTHHERGKGKRRKVLLSLFSAPIRRIRATM